MLTDAVDPKDVPVVILCGGRGTRFNSETQTCPKPMIPVGTEPILLHVMRIYGAFGFRRFVLCLGYKSDVVKRFFLEFDLLTRDFSLRLGKGGPTFHGQPAIAGWEITFAETGLDTQTGGRIRRAAKYLDAAHFMVTYADGLSDVNLARLLEFHVAHGKVGTVTGVRPASQFGELQVAGSRVSAFAEKPTVSNRINGGFFVFRREFLDYFDENDACVLESGPLVRLTADGQLCMYEHDGFWQCMDTHKDWLTLNDVWNGGHAPWAKA